MKPGSIAHLAFIYVAIVVFCVVAAVTLSVFDDALNPKHYQTQGKVT